MIKKHLRPFIKGFASSTFLMFRNNKLSRFDKQILEKDKIKILKNTKYEK